MLIEMQIFSTSNGATPTPPHPPPPLQKKEWTIEM